MIASDGLIPVSNGTIQDMLVKTARLVKAPVERIRQTVTQLPVAHYDETGWRVAGKLHWLHCACNEQWRYYTVQEKRGQEGITDMDVLPNATGVAVHDFWKPYQKYDNVDQWQSLYELTDATLESAKKSYDRTMDIIGNGLTECKSHFGTAKTQREEAYYTQANTPA